MVNNHKAVAILSGGIDSATALVLARKSGWDITYAVFFSYGQKHLEPEYLAAKALAVSLTVELNRYMLPLIAGSALTQGGGDVPQRRDMSHITDGSVAPTYVPNRNMIMIAYAGAVAYAKGASGIVGGWHQEDTSGYPDCREQFLSAAEITLHEATGGVVNTIIRPLALWNKTQVVKAAFDNMIPLEYTWSCYNPVVHPAGGYGPKVFYGPCGVCDACTIRLHAFKEAGLTDPLGYPNE